MLIKCVVIKTQLNKYVIKRNLISHHLIYTIIKCTKKNFIHFLLFNFICLTNNELNVLFNKTTKYI